MTLTINFTKCKTCKVWKDSKGRGTKACLKCNPFRETLSQIKPLDCIPDDIIQQYPDLQTGKIRSILDGIAHLKPGHLEIFCQAYIGRMKRKELEAFWANPPYLGYSGKQLERIVKQALKTLQEIVKK